MPSGEAKEKEKEIPQLTEDIQNAMERLESTKEKLFSKTVFVARPSPPEDQAKEESQGAVTDLGARLLNIRSRVDSLNSQLLDLISRIEL